jgi:hypothetical protein
MTHNNRSPEELRTLRQQVRTLRERGREAHVRFMGAYARQDRDAMQATSAAHAAITSEAITVTNQIVAHRIAASWGGNSR